MDRLSEISVNERRLIPVAIMKYAAVGLLMFIFFSPFAALIVETFRFIQSHQNEWLKLVIPGERRSLLLIQSIGLSGATALTAALSGTLIALRLLVLRKGIASLARWLVPLLLIIPLYIHVNAWTFLFDELNKILYHFNLQPINFTGFNACWLVQTAAYLPVTAGLSLLGFEAINSEFTDIGRVFSNDMRVFTRLILPLSLRFIISGAGIVFLMTFVDYTIPSLLQVNVYPMEIFAEFSSTNEPASAFLLSLPVLIVSVPVIFTCFRNIRKINLSNLWNKAVITDNNMQWPLWLDLLQQFALIFFIMAVLVPVAAMFIKTGSLSVLISSVSSSYDAIRYSIIISSAAAALLLPLSVAVSDGLIRKGLPGKLWWLAAAVPIAIPAPLIGIGIISVWNREIFSNVYGSILMPVLASAIRYMTIAGLVLWLYMSRFDKLLIDAASVFGRNNLHIWRRIKLPMLLPGIISAFFISYALSIGELGSSIITIPPGKSTLAIKIYNYLHYGSNETVASLCLFMLAAAMISGILALILFGRRSRSID